MCKISMSNNCQAYDVDSCHLQIQNKLRKKEKKRKKEGQKEFNAKKQTKET